MPAEIPQTLVPFFQTVLESIFSLWFAADKLSEVTASDVVKTTDGTVTTLHLIPLKDEHTYHIKSIVIGVKAGGTDRASYEITGTFYRTGGSATQQGTTTVVHSAESVAGWDATFDVSGNDVRVRVTGAASTTMDWRCSTKYMGISN